MRRTVRILDRASDQLVDAELTNEIGMEHLLEAQEKWRPIVVAEAKRQAAAGTPASELPSHWHWDWSLKRAELELLGIVFYGIKRDSELQGLMKLETGPQWRCRLEEQRGKELIYVDYAEVAPWNVRLLTPTPRYGAVGSRLVEAAVRESIAQGFKGRLGLHSLPTSEGFYKDSCGMTPVERDDFKQDLLWMEYTPEQAKRFLSEE